MFSYKVWSYCYIFPGLENPPDIKDVLLYATHPDPQLRGHTTVIIGNFITTVLVEGRGDFGKWIEQNSSENQGKSASHPDPQLRGHTTVIIGNFISTVLVEGRGDFGKWIEQNSSENQCKGAYGTFLS